MNKKIAVCISGEPRSVYLGSTFIKKYYKEFDVDYFCHAWEKSTEEIPPNNQAIKYNEYNIQEQKLYNDIEALEKYITKIYEPKDILVENYTEDRFYGQFLGAERVIALKKDYEKRNNFKYDIVVRMRYDTAITDESSDKWGYSVNRNNEKRTFYIKGPNNIPISNLSLDTIYVNNVRIDAQDNTRHVAISDHGPFIGTSSLMDKYHEGNFELLKEYFNSWKIKRNNKTTLSDTIYMTHNTPYPEILWNLLFNYKEILPKKYNNIHFHVVLRAGCPITTDAYTALNYHIYRDRVKYGVTNEPFNRNIKYGNWFECTDRVAGDPPAGIFTISN